MLASLFTKPNELWFERRDAEKETQVIFWVLSDLLPNRCRTNFSKFGKFSSSSQVGLSVNCFSRCISVSPPPAAAACWSDQPAELRLGLFVQVWEVFKQHRLLSGVHSLNLPVDPSWEPIGEYHSNHWTLSKGSFIPTFMESFSILQKISTIPCVSVTLDTK